MDSFCIFYFITSYRYFLMNIKVRQVKCLYDTFHEPFKRAVPNHGPVAENPINTHAGESEDNGKEKEIQDASKKRKKEPEINVKSALKAAFAKYGELGRKKNTVVRDEGRGKNVDVHQMNNNEDDAT